MKITPAALLPLSVIFVLLTVGLTFSPCLGCFYFSEDYIQTWLASQALTIHPEVIWQHFTRPWFQCSNMGLFYRPLVEMSFLSDSLIYGRNVAGFHLTNLTCHLISTLMCLLITRLLMIRHLARANNTQLTLTGLTAALLFGLNPLHCETVYWLVCRCDCFCTMFSLTGVYFGLLSRNKDLARPRRQLLIILSVVACLCGALAKEQALLVPFVLLLQYWMYPDNSSGKVQSSLRYIAPYFVMLVLYSAVRLTVLGGIGGYHGTIGFLLNESPIARFFSPVAWSKIFYPMDQDSFSSKPWCALLYSLSYCLMALGSYLGWRTKTFAEDRYKLIRFLIGSSILVLIPAYQSFVIVESLFGSRCIYMSQAFISMAMALLFSCLRPIKLRNILLPAYLLLLAYTNIIDGTVWLARSNNLRALQGAVNQWAGKASKNRKLCLLNLPLDARELSSLYDLEQLRCLLKPPINALDISDRVVQPTYLRMSPDAVNSSRLKEFLADQDVDFALSSVGLGQPFKLISGLELRQHFLPIDTTVSNIRAQKPPDMSEQKNTEGYELCLETTITPQRADCVEVTVAPVTPALSSSQDPDLNSNDLTAVPVMRAQPLSLCPHGKTVLLLWYTDLTMLEPYLNWSTAQFIDDGKPRTYIFPLGDRLSWKYASKVFHVVFGNLPRQYKIVKIRLRDEKSIVPTLKAISLQAATADLKELSGRALAWPDRINDDDKADGFFAVNDKQNVRVIWDASKVEGAKATKLQVSLPDFMYAHYAGGFREFELENHSQKTIYGGPLCGQARLSRADFPITGKYQVRLSAIDKNGQVIGFCSDPIDLMVTDAPFTSAFAKAVFNLRAQPHR